jgi:hypothetical protein
MPSGELQEKGFDVRSENGETGNALSCIKGRCSADAPAFGSFFAGANKSERPALDLFLVWREKFTE